MTTSLQTQAMLVTLSVSCWTGRVQDKKVSAEVEQTHGATDAGRYNKLLVDKAHMDPLVQFAGKVRQYHYKMTLPWLDNGARPNASWTHSSRCTTLASCRTPVSAWVRCTTPQITHLARTSVTSSVSQSTSSQCLTGKIFASILEMRSVSKSAGKFLKQWLTDRHRQRWTPGNAAVVSYLRSRPDFQPPSPSYESLLSTTPLSSSVFCLV